MPDKCVLTNWRQIMRLMCLTSDKIGVGIGAGEYHSDSLWHVYTVGLQDASLC